MTDTGVAIGSTGVANTGSAGSTDVFDTGVVLLTSADFVGKTVPELQTMANNNFTDMRHSWLIFNDKHTNQVAIVKAIEDLAKIS